MIRKSIILTLILTAALLASPLAYPAQWNEAANGRFIVYYNQDQPFAEEVARAAENIYSNLSKELGLEKETRACELEKIYKIYVYDTHACYLESTKVPSWYHGHLDYKINTICGYRWDCGFIEGLLTHELVHVLLREFFGDEGKIPCWLDEGLATSQTKEVGPRYEEIGRRAALDGKLIPLDEILTKDITRETDEERMKLFFGQSVCMVNFLLATGRKDSLFVLCKALRDGKELNQALQAAYHNRIENVQALNKNWIDYVIAQASIKERGY